MSRFSLLSSLFLAGIVSCGCAAADRPVHLFILSGQSNMARLDPETCFLPEARALLRDATVVHIKVAVGGAPIRFWLPEWDAIAEAAGVSQRNEKGPILYERILAEVANLQRQHGSFASITFCWSQGGRDAKTGLEAAYEAALTRLIANLRRDLKRPDMNVVISRSSDHDPGEPWRKGWERIQNIQMKVAREDPHGAWVFSDDLNDIEKNGKMTNDLHHTPEGYVVFGQRFARQSVRLIRGEKPDPNGKPEPALKSK